MGDCFVSGAESMHPLLFVRLHTTFLKESFGNAEGDDISGWDGLEGSFIPINPGMGLEVVFDGHGCYF